MLTENAAENERDWPQEFTPIVEEMRDVLETENERYFKVFCGPF